MMTVLLRFPLPGPLSAGEAVTHFKHVAGAQ